MRTALDAWRCARALTAARQQRHLPDSQDYGGRSLFHHEERFVPSLSQTRFTIALTSFLNSKPVKAVKVNPFSIIFCHSRTNSNFLFIYFILLFFNAFFKKEKHQLQSYNVKLTKRFVWFLPITVSKNYKASTNPCSISLSSSSKWERQENISFNGRRSMLLFKS